MDLTGLLGGVAEGLKAGWQGYDTERRYQDKKAEEAMERAIKERAYKLQLAQSGYEESPFGGGFQMTADAKKDKAFKRATDTAGLLKTGYQTGEYNPTTGQYDVVETPTSIEDKKVERRFKGSQANKAEADVIESKAKARKLDAETKGLLNPQPDPAASKDLRSQFLGLPTTKETQQIASSFEKVKSAASNPSPAGDLSLVFAYMKMLDPGSAVKETEFANAQNAAGVPDRIRNMWNRMQTGELLPDKQRQDFVNHSGHLYNAQVKAQKKFDDYYTDLATRQRVNPRDVVIPFEPYSQESLILGNKNKTGGLIPNAMANSSTKPGTIVNITGEDGKIKRYKVAPDGDTLIEVP